MTKKAGWEEPTTGPDWIDVESMMRSLAALHSGEVGLTLLPRGTGGTGGLSVCAAIQFTVLPGSSLPEFVHVIREWPCAQHKTLVGHAFALLHELDWKIGQTYEQGKLWT